MHPKSFVSNFWGAVHNIDVCFISHLDEDHCNGVQFLNPKVIILPLVEKWDRAIFWLSNQLGYSNFNVNIKEYLKSKAPDAKIVEVEGFRPDVDDINSEELQHNVIDINDSIRDIIRSGTRIRTSSHDGDDSINWIYVPINPLLDQAIITKFEQYILSENLDRDKILQCDTQYFEDNKKTLNSIYKRLGKLNDLSMTVYSGPSYISDHFLPYVAREWGGTDVCRCHRMNWFGCACLNSLYPGCLYLGDLSLKGKKNSKNQIGRPVGYVLRKVYTFLGKSLVDYIGTIQVPHHGSRHNYNSVLKKYFDGTKWEFYKHPIVYVISAGVNNKYGHPSKSVVIDLMKTANCINKVCLVTEKFNSIYAERIIYLG